MAMETATTWRYLADDELRHYLHLYERDLADDPTADDRAYLAMLVADARREWARRERAVAHGVPLDVERFSDAFKDDLKRHVALDTLFEYELGARLGRAGGTGWRRGPCPICGSASDAPFGVYVADETRQKYHCFACGAGGDAINAIRQIYGDTFNGAIERLARRGGIALPTPPAAPRNAAGPPAAPPRAATRPRHRGPTFPP